LVGVEHAGATPGGAVNGGLASASLVLSRFAPAFEGYVFAAALNGQKLSHVFAGRDPNGL
jgi:hypothetical protein